ncbi:hypothetical protein ACFW88_34400 [Streptomyces anandii]|uniref:Uncharacterized protein n=2 Tax=Streptomyces anandii TaxID=285454 RepID=A0ABW6HGV3_9ACTN
MRKLAAATLMAMTMGSFTSYVGGVAFAVGPGGATATGGSAGGDLSQQNVAQEGRQNSACDLSTAGDISLDPGQLRGRCVNGDGSYNEFTRVRYKGARAVGGDGVTSVEQQNIAQKGRQNNACADSIDFTLEVTGGLVGDECSNKDHSRNKYTLFQSGGADAVGASGLDGPFQNNIAQEGRQNNACATNNDADFDLTGGRTTSRCDNGDGSDNERVLTKGGGAHVKSGSGTGFEEENIAQEGRQNNACDSGVFFLPDLEGGRLASECVNRDHSSSKDVLVRGGGSRVRGGDGAEFQQNIAQEGRQNNACDNSLFPEPPDAGDARVDSRCANVDGSRTKDAVIKGRGTRVDGGSSAASLIQQNIGQEGRQNNACNNVNMVDVTDLTLSGGSAEFRCATVDRSENEGTKEIGGGARIHGGSAVADANQQNIAQEGRQNNACGNHNALDGVSLTDTRVRSSCATVDDSVNKGTTRIGGGARVEGGSSLAGLFQQNIAQEGRQNNACGNSNDLSLTATDARIDSQCLAVDRSVNIGSQES